MVVSEAETTDNLALTRHSPVPRHTSHPPCSFTAAGLPWPAGSAAPVYPGALWTTVPRSRDNYRCRAICQTPGLAWEGVPPCGMPSQKKQGDLVNTFSIVLTREPRGFGTLQQRHRGVHQRRCNKPRSRRLPLHLSMGEDGGEWVLASLAGGGVLSSLAGGMLL